MLEVEVKFPVADLGKVRQQLLALGAQPRGCQKEMDHYFNAPDRDYAQTDEAVRLRSVDGQNCLTYKGPKLDGETKTRTEIEVPLEAGPHAEKLATAFLTHLGYRPVARVEKTRETLHLTHQEREVTITLDQVEGVGTYAELEIVTDATQKEESQRAILSLAALLGLGPSERRSYLELFLTRRQ